MKPQIVHHLHVKYRGETYVIGHRKDSMSLQDLMTFIRFVKEDANGNKKIRA